MSYGIKIFNPITGSIVIDENYANLSLYRVVDLVSQEVIDISTETDANLSFLGYNAIVTDITSGELLVCAVYADGVFQYTTGVGLYDDIDGVHLFHTGYMYAPVGTAFRLFFFAAPRSISGGLGLAVYDAAGALTFHSSYKYLRLSSFLSGSDYQVSLPGTTLTSGRTYAIMAVRFAGRTVAVNSEGGGFSYQDVWGLFYKTTGHIITSAEVYIEHENAKTFSDPPRDSFNNFQYAVMLVDVTNY